LCPPSAICGKAQYQSATTGWTFFLFERPDPDPTFAFLGPITYESHTGDRPIAITWRLATPIAVLYDRYATLRRGSGSELVAPLFAE
jgi:hypothetical protein